jgi:hypothetical protein
MASTANPAQLLPQCPVCGGTLFAEDCAKLTPTAECRACGSIMPIEALMRWAESRRMPRDFQLMKALALIEASSLPFDQACSILRLLSVQ